jgi:hypothetical protein
LLIEAAIREQLAQIAAAKDTIDTQVAATEERGRIAGRVSGPAVSVQYVSDYLATSDGLHLTKLSCLFSMARYQLNFASVNLITPRRR